VPVIIPRFYESALDQHADVANDAVDTIRNRLRPHDNISVTDDHYRPASIQYDEIGGQSGRASGTRKE
jgi:hypothetical protein